MTGGSSSRADAEEGTTDERALTAHELLKPIYLNYKAIVPSMSCEPLRVHLGHHDHGGNFMVNSAFLQWPKITCELFAKAPGKLVNQLALAIKMTPQQGPSELIGTFGKPWPSMEPCYVA